MIKVASYLVIVMYVTFLTILSYLDMGLFDSQN
ncbi:putative membrane protein, partial [Acinetobacter baumannii 21072]